jgi:2-methylisocitrate lyase-like PEP mutase family enzyme
LPLLSAAISAIARSSSTAAALSCSCTLSPSFTSTRLTTLRSSGCKVLVRSLTTMRPAATDAQQATAHLQSHGVQRNKAQAHAGHHRLLDRFVARDLHRDARLEAVFGEERVHRGARASHPKVGTRKSAP